MPDCTHGEADWDSGPFCTKCRERDETEWAAAREVVALVKEWRDAGWTMPFSVVCAIEQYDAVRKE